MENKYTYVLSTKPAMIDATPKSRIIIIPDKRIYTNSASEMEPLLTLTKRVEITYYLNDATIKHIKTRSFFKMVQEEFIQLYHNYIKYIKSKKQK